MFLQDIMKISLCVGGRIWERSELNRRSGHVRLFAARSDYRA